MTTSPVTIVLAEDDDGHAALIQRNLERAGLANGFIGTTVTNTGAPLGAASTNKSSNYDPGIGLRYQF